MMRAIAVAALATTLSAALAGEGVKGTGDSTNVLSTVLVAEKTAVHLGDPIKVSLSVKNQGDRGTKVDNNATAFDCFEVTGPDGQPIPYVGYVGQVIMNPVALQPSAIATVAKGLDLTDQYLFPKSGRYAIRFRGANYGAAMIPFPPYSAALLPPLPPSNPIIVDVTLGQLGELDEIVAELLPICPTGYHITKSSRGQSEVTPFARAPVPGYSLQIFRNRMSGDAVYLWLTKVKVPSTPDQKSSRSEYLGHTKGLHVYVAEDSKTPEAWPKALEDISRVLQIVKE